MSFSILLVLLSTISLSFASPILIQSFKQTDHDDANITRCVYVPEKSAINCHNLDGVVECSAERKLTSDLLNQVIVLGIKDTGVGSSDIKQIKYVLYLKGSNNITFLNTATKLYLYHGQDSNEHGIRVVNLNCYQRLVSLLRSSHVKKLVSLEKGSTKVSLIGEVLSVISKELNKKQKKLANPIYWNQNSYPTVYYPSVYYPNYNYLG